MSQLFGQFCLRTMADKDFNFIFLLLAIIPQCYGDKVVQTDVGNFRGYTASDGEYTEFLGIPYGQVNTENPFGVSSSYPAISGTFNANDDSTKCPQMENGVIVGSLDCLRLNVYTPSYAITGSQLPVMVYLHGGFFQRGNGNKESFGPRFLVRHGVIVVTINYRTGPYGFMCLNRRDVPGNQGLKDQVLALKWVKDNICNFGGNPDLVTVFGISAGGHSIDLHLLSEQEQLYNKVIIQSGSSLASTVIYEPDREAPIKLANYLGLDSGTFSKTLRSLSNAAPSDVIRAATQLNMEFKPCAETQFEGVDAFITNYWINSSVPKAQGLPIMIGFTEYERLTQHFGQNNDHFQSLGNIFYDYLNQTFDFDDVRINRMAGHVRRFYLGDDAISTDTVYPIINFESDYMYNYPIQRSIKKFIDSRAGNIFYYMFAYSGGRNDASIKNLNVQKAAHGDDIRYLFDFPAAPTTISTQDQIIIDRMTEMWTNFAKYSDPTPQVSALLPKKWIPIELNSQTGNIYHCMRIDTELIMARRPFNKRLTFLELFYKLNNDYQRSFEAIAAADEEDENDGNNSTISSANVLNILFTLILVAIFRQ